MICQDGKEDLCFRLVPSRRLAACFVLPGKVKVINVLREVRRVDREVSWVVERAVKLVGDPELGVTQETVVEKELNGTEIK